MSETAHVGVYGELNANLLDGSSIWLQSVCLTLALVPRVRVTVLLREPIERELVVGPLLDHPRIRVASRPVGEPLREPAGAVAALAELDREDRFDFLLLRGAGVAAEAMTAGSFDGRIWLYHVPQGGEESDDLAPVARSAHRVLCQTDAIRRQVVQVSPALESRAVILPPMIPAVDPGPRRHEGPIRRILYAGKISPEYYGLEMIELLTKLRAVVPGVELHVAGDKVHDPPGDPAFRERAKTGLRNTPGLVWHGALTREGVAALVRGADVALSLRDPELDASAEMSTKVLEYGAVGCPVLLNANDFHAGLLGEDYPLMASGVGDAVAKIVDASENPAIREEAGRRVWELAHAHTFGRVAEALVPHLERGRIRVGHGGAAGPKLLVTGHSFGFVQEVVERAQQAGAEVRWDRWSGHATREEEPAEAESEWADVVLCEWCLGNAVWHSVNKRSGQTLVVRFHRMEQETSHPASVDMDAVDSLVFVAPHVRAAACEKFGWSLDDPRLSVVPNAVDVERFRREKLPGSEFTLGMIGYVPWLKRLDRALDIVERLRARDDRYRLVVKGRGPWSYEWMSAREDERREYQRAFERVERSPVLGSGSVTFEPFGDDIPEFLQRIGWILSTSEVEGHSVAVAEGMASGSIPVLLDRRGADQQYDPRWVHKDPRAAADAILCLRNGGIGEESKAAARFATRWSWNRIGPVWDGLLGLGRNAGAAAEQV